MIVRTEDDKGTRERGHGERMELTGGYSGRLIYELTVEV